MLPLAIVAHPDREELVHELTDQLPDAAVFWDTRGIGAGRNHLVAWRHLAESGADWGVVIEDDVLLAPDFHDQVRAAIHSSPSHVLSLYLGRGRPPQWQQRIANVITYDVSYYTAPEMLSCQGYAMPTEFFGDYASVGKRLRTTVPIEVAISQWCKKRGTPVSYCRWSLVDHLDGPTLIPDHGDGQPRNGKTALVTKDSYGGEDLPEVRKAWLFPPRQMVWNRGSYPL